MTEVAEVEAAVRPQIAKEEVEVGAVVRPQIAKGEVEVGTVVRPQIAKEEAEVEAAVHPRFVRGEAEVVVVVVEADLPTATEHLMKLLHHSSCSTSMQPPQVQGKVAVVLVLLTMKMIQTSPAAAVRNPYQMSGARRRQPRFSRQRPVRVR